MRLKVPFIAQTNRQLCGSAVADMVLRYYGISANRDLLERVLQEHHGGTDLAKIGRIFLQNNFVTEFVSGNPDLLGGKHHGRTQEEIRGYLEELARFDYEGSHNDIMLQSLLEYMNEGGIVRLEAPTAAMVHAEIDAGRPVIGFLTTSFTKIGRPLKNAHYVVINGYRRKKTFVLDPIRERTYTEEKFLGSFGGNLKIVTSALFGGLYSDDNTALDEGSILLIRKKQ